MITYTAIAATIIKKYIIDPPFSFIYKADIILIPLCIHVFTSCIRQIKSYAFTAWPNNCSAVYSVKL